jgi:SWI/SNF-related matrix-associated actin-dependent regulator 1 of chromatin subfamily A
LIDETVVPNFWTYAQKYCGARHNGYGWDFSGATNTEELHEKLVNTIMIRRKKSEVLKDLPEKLRAFVPMELNNRDTYRNAEVDFINFVRQYKGQAAANRASNAQALAEIEGLKQLAVKGKMNQAIDWIENFLEVDGKLVVFAIHKFVIDMLMERFGNVAVKIDGSVSGVNRDQAVQRFQTDDATRLFVGNIRAAGVGLTLTAANNVVFLELPWTPGELTQAEDRCHRIGQQGNVTINFLLAENTIEEKIARLIDNKQRVLDSVLDGKETEEESLLSELINQYE